MIPAIALFLFAAAVLGCLLGWNYLKGVRSKPGLIAAHLLLGAAGLEQVAILLHGQPNGDAWPSASLANTAGALLALGMVLGFATPLVRQSRQTMNTVLVGHVGVAAAGFVLFLAWAARLGH
jgi:hypothetical protein